MSKPKGGAATDRSPAATAEAPSNAATRELVGWARQSPLSQGDRLSADVARRVLATALGLEEDAVSTLAPAVVRTALDRLRSLAAYCDHLSSEAMTDELTGALRRGAGMSALQRELDRARRMSDLRIVAVFLDVDGLKALNDSQGHAAGDELLRSVVAAIHARIRSYDLVLRYGGDEFVCALVGVTRAQAERTVNEIRGKVARSTRGHTFSAGIAEAAADDSAESLVARADAALYRERERAAAAS